MISDHFRHCTGKGVTKEGRTNYSLPAEPRIAELKVLNFE
jgi:hypothetical protein